MKPKWSVRVWVGVSKQPLSDARTVSEARSVSSIICRALEASSKEEQAINKSSTYNNVRMPWRRRAATTTDMTLVQILGELVHPSGNVAWERKFDDLMIKVAQVHRRLSRGHRWREVWS